jgi:hypothetical protein
MKRGPAEQVCRVRFEASIAHPALTARYDWLVWPFERLLPTQKDAPGTPLHKGEPRNSLRSTHFSGMAKPRSVLNVHPPRGLLPREPGKVRTAGRVAPRRERP